MKNKMSAGFSAIKTRAYTWENVIKRGLKEKEGAKYLGWLIFAFVASGARFGADMYPFGVALCAAFAFTPLNLFTGLAVAIAYAAFLKGEGLCYLGGVLVCISSGVMIGKDSQNTKLVPLIGAAAIGFTSGFMRISENVGSIGFVISEIIIAALFSYCYTLLEKENKNAGIISVFLTAVMFLSSVYIFKIVSISRIMVVFAILLYMYSGKAENSVFTAVGFGTLMDISMGSIYYSGIYGITATLMGVMKIKGRFLISGIYTLATFIIALIYKDNAMAIGTMIESLAASLIFVMMPACTIENMSCRLYHGKEEKKSTAIAVNDGLKEKISALSEAICYISNALEDVTHKYGKKNNENISEVFDRAADSTCKRCPISGNCWDKDYMTTYAAMNDVSQTIRKKGYISAEDFPHHFSSRCLNVTRLVGNINEEYSLYTRRVMRDKGECEQRKLMAKQYLSMHKAIKNIEEASKSMTEYYPEYERRIQQIIRCYDKNTKVSVYSVSGRMCIELFGNIGSIEEDIFQIMDSISLGTGREFYKPIEIRIAKGRLFRIKEKEKFSISVSVGIREKKGEAVCGDNNMYFTTDDGRGILMISDGMGSGEEAEKVSKNALSLISRFVMAGCSIEESVMAVLPVLSMNVEKTGFATLDLLEINMFTGESKLLKYGAPPTYIKRHQKVQKVVSSAFPPGLEECTEQVNKPIYFKLNEGNTVIMGTDGVFECYDTEELEMMIKTEEEPQSLINLLINKAQAEKERAEDDMTVLIAKIKKTG